MNAARDEPTYTASLTAAVMARRSEWTLHDPSEAEMRALERLSPTKATSDEEADAKAEAEEEWRLFRGGSRKGHPSFDSHRLLRLVVWSCELAALHDDEKDLLAGLRAFNAELKAAAGLLFEFFLDRSSLDRASYYKLFETSYYKPQDTEATHDPLGKEEEVVGAFKMQWVLDYLSVNLLWDAAILSELPHPPAAYKSDGKARVFEHRLAGFLQRMCGQPSLRLVLAISRVLYPEATPIMDTALYKRRSHEKAWRLKHATRSRESAEEAEALFSDAVEPDCTNHSWYGKPPDTHRGERKVRAQGARHRLIERISKELQCAEREAENFEREVKQARRRDEVMSRSAPVPSLKPSQRS